MRVHLHFPVWTSVAVICRTWEEDEEEEGKRKAGAGGGNPIKKPLSASCMLMLGAILAGPALNS